MGTAFRIAVFTVENEIEFISAKKAEGMKLFCAVPDNGAPDIRLFKNQNGIIAAVGNEGNGLSTALKALGESVTIHMSGTAQSLNASQAATIIMYEMMRDE
jgi:TrmH family RNA methyltransferase